MITTNSENVFFKVYIKTPLNMLSKSKCST